MKLFFDANNLCIDIWKTMFVILEIQFHHVKLTILSFFFDMVFIFTIQKFSLRWGPVIDKSLALKKISRSNDSYFSLSSWRIVFSFPFLFSIFKILRPKFSFSSQFVRFFKKNSLSLLNFQDSEEQILFLLDLWDSLLCFSFSSCEKCLIF